VYWDGIILLRELYDRNCNITKAELDFTRDAGGATLEIAGDSVFASFTVQSPTPFTDYNHVGDNAVGRVVYANPSVGSYMGYNVVVIGYTHGDEYKVVSTTSLHKTVTGFQLDFDLGIGYLGGTVYAEIHAGPSLKTDSKAIYVPT